MTTPRGDKDTERTPIIEGIENVQDNEQPMLKGEKYIKDGHIYIRCGEQVFDAFGRKVK
jgi:hypothetical protein